MLYYSNLLSRRGGFRDSMTPTSPPAASAPHVSTPFLHPLRDRALHLTDIEAVRPIALRCVLSERPSLGVSAQQPFRSWQFLASVRKKTHGSVLFSCQSNTVSIRAETGLFRRSRNRNRTQGRKNKLSRPATKISYRNALRPRSVHAS